MAILGSLASIVEIPIVSTRKCLATPELKNRAKNVTRIRYSFILEFYLIVNLKKKLKKNENELLNKHNIFFC